MTHIHRFFLSTNIATGDQVSLDEGDRFHAVKVLRLREGDAIEVADPAGKVFSAQVSAIDGTVDLVVGEMLESETVSRGLIVAQALPRGRKMDLVVEKLSELGVDTLVPLETGKSVAMPEAEGEKVQRWRRIARAAAGQAKRTRVMRLENPQSFNQWIADAPATLVVMATTAEVEAEPLGEVLKGSPSPAALVVGPESGFSSEEIAILAARGVRFARLGQQVLRTETAALVAATIVLHHMGEVG